MAARNNITRLFKLSAISVLLGTSAGANASAVGVYFESVNGEQVRTTPEQVYINPSSEASFALIAGVDRAINYKLTLNGSVLENETSRLLGANDRIVSDGRSYYGIKPTLSFPSEGEYELEVNILNGAGDAVDTFTYSLIVDRTAPELSGDFEVRYHSVYGTTHTDGLIVTARGNTDFLRMGGANDNLSGLSHAKISTYIVSDSGEKTPFIESAPAQIEGDYVQVGSGLRGSVPSNLIPAQETKLYVEFELFDNAGNSTTSGGYYYSNNTHNDSQPVPFAVYTGTSEDHFGVSQFQGFEPYTPGMTIYNNPVRMIYKGNREHYYGGGGDADIYGNWVVGSGTRNTNHIIHTDADWVYFDISGSTDGTRINESQFFTRSDLSWRRHLFRHDLTFYSDAIKPPQGVELEAYVDGLDEWLPRTHYITMDDTDGVTNHITKIRVTVEPRAYDQRFSYSFGSVYGTQRDDCIIPAGEVQCILDTNLPYPAFDVNRYHNRHIIRDAETGLLRSPELVSVWSYDGDPAVFLEDTFEINSRLKTASFSADDHYATRLSSTTSMIRDMRLIFEGDNGTHHVTSSGSLRRNMVESTVERFTASFDYSSVPDGVYDVYAYIEDGFSGNRSRNTQRNRVRTQFVVDSTPPVIAINHQEQISSLDDISLNVVDNRDPTPNVVSANIQGGPASDSVFLPTRRVTDSEFSLEYPVLFPSLEEGEEYTLTVVAIDNQGNEATRTSTFRYQPRLVELSSEESMVRLPHIHEHVTRADGMNALYTAPLTLGDGSVVAGEYAIYATMRSDAEVPLIINGLRVNPGDTVDIADAYNFSATGGRFNLEVYPAEGSQPGVSSLLIGSTAPNAPILVADVVTVPMESVTQFNDDSPRQVIDPMNLTVSPLAGSAYCDLTVSYDTALAADPFRDPICLVEFDAPGMNVRTVDDNGRVHLNGFVRGTGEHEISYTVSLLGHQGTRHELAQDSVTLDVRSAMNALALEVTNDISEVQHYVEPVATVLQMQQGLGCDLTSSRSEAIQYAIDLVDDTMRPKCLVEWESVPEGLSLFNDSLGVRGYLEEMGEQPLSWRVSLFYEGEEQLTLATQSYDIDVVEPTAPRVTQSTLTYTSGRSSSGTSHLLRDSRVGVQRVAVTLDEQVYPQIVTINDQQCTIAQGDNRCHVVMDTAAFGSPDSNPQGHYDFNIQVEAGAGRDYFVVRDLGASTHRMNWDYTPPQVANVVINPSVDGTEMPLQVGNQQLSIPGDRVAIAVATPFTYLPGSDWHLADPALIIESDSTIEYQQLVSVDDRRFFFPHSRQDVVRNNRIAPADMEVIDGHMVYHYDISVLADGAFTFDVNVSDTYNNGDWYHQDAFFLQRTAPQMQLLFGGEAATHVNEMFFASDFGAVANPGWDLQNEIISASYGGVPLEIHREDTPRSNVAFFDGDVSELEQGEQYELLIRARDTAGNIGELRHPMTYAPSYFRVSSGTRGTEIYRNVQRAIANVNQSVRLCNLSSSREAAQLFSRVQRKGCYVQVLDMPDTMDSSFEGWGLRVSGPIQSSDDNAVTIAGVLVNPDGREVVTAPQTLAFDVLEPEELKLHSFAPHAVAPGVYAIQPEGRLISRYTIENVSGALDIDLAIAGTHFDQSQEQRMLNKYEVVDTIIDEDLVNRRVFDRYPVNLDVAYELAPEIGVSYESEVIVVPSRRAGIHLQVQNQGDIHSTDNVEFAASIGQWMAREQATQYDARTMGEWDIYLGYRSSDGVVRLTDDKTIDANGVAHFSVPAEKIFRKATSIVAYATVRSPHPEINLSLTSTPASVRVLLGSSISGELAASRVTGRAPFMLIARYDFESSEDQMAASDTQWQISTDKQTWETLSEFNGRSAIPLLLSEAGERYLRATTTNRHTGESTTTQILEVAAYDRPSLRLAAPNLAYPEQTIDIQMMNFDTPLTDEDGWAQWSIDRGETWFDGGTTQEFTINDEIDEVRGRFRYHNTSDLVQADGWTEARYTSRVVAPTPMRVQIDAPHLVELGHAIEVKANTTNMNGPITLPTRLEWRLPNGETRSDESFEFVPTSADLDDTGRLQFELRAWIEGYEEQTSRTTVRRLDTWEYTFPDAQINLRTGIAVAPSQVMSTITYERSFMPGIQYTFEWLDDPAYEVQSPKQQATTITVNEPGVHEIRALISDNRGGSRVLSQFIDVLEPEPIKNTMSTFASNRHDRAPLGLIVRAQTTGGHPRDYMAEFEWYLNGEQVESPRPNSPMHRFELNEPGKHTLRVVGRSNFGQVFEDEFTYTVVENQPPVCNPATVPSGSFMRVNANCTDEDGFITAYHWWINGEYLGRGAGYAQLRVDEDASSTTVRFEAVDDAGGVTEGSVTF